ncbi:hypothetical protein [Oscillibacter sp.]|uniref:hypothetical protein n=1 Tax=Oscillibacter sp. TaxID=1945593 RepID=UPI002610C063|nr:hypothetical protein [Oscillibacter sp.]MDD3346606.1 hypothetical protein [Oscillibacter sp.]
MEIFRPDGHLSDAALCALMQESNLDELARLEIAEHLSYCDSCLQRYTNALSGAELQFPPHSCRESLFRRIRQRTLRLVTSRYATAVAAVALALTVVWGSGNLDFIPRLPEASPAFSQRLRTWPEEWNASLNRALSDFNNLFSGSAQQRSEPTQGGTHS